MTPQRTRRFALLVGLAFFSWPMMMLVHEFGHVLGAWMTGGTIRQIVWHPLVFSRTDVDPNPSPNLVAWMGPVVGVLVPLLRVASSWTFRRPLHYLFALFAGFCLIANGAYIAVGALQGVGDANEMMAYGTARWVLIVFGLVTVPMGFWLWHSVSPRLGFGRVSERVAIRASHAYTMLVLGILLNVIGLIFGNRGV